MSGRVKKAPAVEVKPPPRRRAAQAEPAPAPAPSPVAGKPISTFSVDEVARRRAALIAESGPVLMKHRVPTRYRTNDPVVVGTLGLSGQGGSGNVARVCADTLAQAGHRSIMLTGGGGEGFWDAAAKRDYEVRALDVPQTPKAPAAEWVDPLAEQIAQTVREEGIQVLSVHYAAGLLDAALKAKELLAKEGRTLAIAATLHGTDVTTYGEGPYGPTLREELLKCDEVTTVSEWLADTAVKTLDLPIRPRVIANAVDTDVFNAHQWRIPAHTHGAGRDLRRKLAPRDEMVMIHVSNMREVKRPLDALETFAKVRAQGIDAKLVMVGDGPMAPTIWSRAQELGVAEHVIPAGVLSPDELPAWLCAADVALVTSKSESFCLAALEAMACGTPVVGTRCGGLEEVMGGLEPGLLADVGDTDELAAACTRLAKDPELYERVQQQCHTVPFEQYTRDRQQQGYLTLIDDLRPNA